MGKYDPLRNYLKNCRRDEVTLSFDEVERIVGFALPSSSAKYDAWWANVDSSITAAHSQAIAWHSAGYSAQADRRGRTVTFRKLAGPGQNIAKIPSHHSSKPKSKFQEPPVVQPEGKRIEVCGYTFTFIQNLVPDCENGKVIRYYPQADYNNVRHLTLNYHGGGAFCRFRINAPESPGVYLWIVGSEILYIGETYNLAQRFNTGYGIIAPRNCYEGGQSTNCKMNKVVMKYYEQGTPIALFFHATNDYKRLELELLGRYNTRYNVKDN